MNSAVSVTFTAFKVVLIYIFIITVYEMTSDEPTQIISLICNSPWLYGAL